MHRKDKVSHLGHEDMWRSQNNPLCQSFVSPIFLKLKLFWTDVEEHKHSFKHIHPQLKTADICCGENLFSFPTDIKDLSLSLSHYV